MVFSLKPKTEKNQSQANAAEVYNLWDLLVANFQTIENFKVFQNFAHDPDLKLLLYNTVNDLEGRTKKLLDLLRQFSIKAVDAPRQWVNTSTNTEVIYDEQIGQWLNGIQNTLKKQVVVLEKEGKKFGLPAPKKPPENTQTFQNTEILDDDFMFESVLEGMQGASILHAQALKQASTNDRIRTLFSQYTLQG